MDLLNIVVQKLLILPGLLIGLSFHEFAHGYVSDRLGDPTPRAQGRLSLSPLHHIDPLGFLMLMVAGFGWAKPVQIDLRFYKKPRRDEILVSLAGVTMNLFIALLFAMLTKILFVAGVFDMMSSNVAQVVFELLYYTIQINIVLLIFNLIPIPPLDGFHVLVNIFPIRHTKPVYFLEQYGMYILIGLILLPVFEFAFNICYSLFRC